jgi:signal transduction histidine kinase
MPAPSSSSTDDPTGGALLRSLARRLSGQKEAILNRWMADLRRRRDIPSADPLPTRELADHIPQLFDELADTLSGGATLPSVKAVSEEARQHGRHRWRQGFPLDELIRDISDLRAVVVDDLEGYLVAVEGLSSEKSTAFALVRDFFDNITIGSVREYISQREGELVKVNEALAAAVARANDLSGTRLKIVRTVSHELRNGANALGIVTSLLEAEGAEAKTREECVGMLQRNLADMRTLLNALLDYSATLEGGAQPKHELVDLCTLEREVAASHEAAAKKKGVSFVSRRDPALGAVKSDRFKLKQIVTNLLTNALKFTEAGGVTLEFLRLPGERWAMRVQDTGRGISPEDQPKLFREFERLGAGDVAGTGLGLVIARQLARQLGGEIVVESALGQGSTFEVQLPLALP